MTLHIFNPEHDIALASGLQYFTAPHAGRALRKDLGWLPAIWADSTDAILVDDTDTAERGLKRLKVRTSCNQFVKTKRDIALSKLGCIDHIEPWGWDAALKEQLRRYGISEEVLPSDEQITKIRSLSHRRTSAELLCAIRMSSPVVGEAKECATSEDVDTLLKQWGKVVIKAPWSSSGRGVRFVDNELTPSLVGWLQNALKNQGSVMVEPYYNKVKDFGMEFYADGKGHIDYLGLSLFHTQNGAYTGNLLGTESYKETEMSRYVPLPLLEQVKTITCQHLGEITNGIYKGPFGIDMMIVSSTEGFDLHHCVEINLRRTMGHVALSLTKLINPTNDDEIVRVMRINYEDNQYKLKIQRL